MRSSRNAVSSASSSGSSERRGAREHRPVEIGADDPPRYGSVGAVAVPDSGDHPRQRRGPRGADGEPPVVLEPGEEWKAAVDRLGEDLADGASPRALLGRDVEQPHSGEGPAVRPGEGPPDHLVARAHRQHRRPSLHRREERPVRAQPFGRCRLGRVLAATEAVQVASRERGIGQSFDELRADASPPRALDEDAAVAPVSVSPEQVGMDDDDGQAHALHRFAARECRSVKAV
jgi:hypothetical protein